MGSVAARCGLAVSLIVKPALARHTPDGSPSAPSGLSTEDHFKSRRGSVPRGRKASAGRSTRNDLLAVVIGLAASRLRFRLDCIARIPTANGQTVNLVFIRNHKHRSAFATCWRPESQ